MIDDEARRREEHLDACWQGCDDLHDDCRGCGDPECDGCWGEESPGLPFVVTADVDRRLL